MNMDSIIERLPSITGQSLYQYFRWYLHLTPRQMTTQRTTVEEAVILQALIAFKKKGLIDELTLGTNQVRAKLDRAINATRDYKGEEDGR